MEFLLGVGLLVIMFVPFWLMVRNGNRQDHSQDPDESADLAAEGVVMTARTLQAECDRIRRIDPEFEPAEIAARTRQSFATVQAAVRDDTFTACAEFMDRTTWEAYRQETIAARDDGGTGRARGGEILDIELEAGLATVVVGIEARRGIQSWPEDWIWRRDLGNDSRGQWHVVEVRRGDSGRRVD